MSTREKTGHGGPERRLERLLGSMSADVPGAGSKRKTLAALGFGTAAVVTTGTAGALGAGGLVKLAATGALCGLVTGGAALGMRYSFTPDARERPSVAAVRAPAAGKRSEPSQPENVRMPEPRAANGDRQTQPARSGAPAMRLDSGGAEPSEGATGQPLENRPTETRSRSVAAFDATPAPASTLQAETAELDRARGAIVAGDPDAGLVALDRYVTAYPHGALAPEAALLRIKALLMSGDRSRARALARSFMAAHPRHAHVEELRVLLAP